MKGNKKIREDEHAKYKRESYFSTVDVLWNVFPLLMVHSYKYKQDQDICDHCELVKFQCIKNYYDFHFFYRQGFLLFETLP